MRSALQAAIAINTTIKTGNCATGKKYYEDCLVRSVVSHGNWTRGYYQLYQGADPASFWKKRATASLPILSGANEFYQKLVAAESRMQKTKEVGSHPPDPLPIQLPDGFLNSYIRISPGVKYVTTTCIDQDLLQERTAVECSHTGQQVAFVNGIDVIPFLRKIDPQKTIAQHMDMFYRMIDSRDLISIIRSLIHTRFISLSDHRP